MNERFRTAEVSHTQPVEISDDARRVLRNTWNLLSLTLLFSAGMALVAMANNWPHPGLVITLVGYFGLLFLTSYLRNSAWGLVSIFALTGFMGATLGSIVSHYLAVFSNGHLLVGAAFGMTGVAFIGLSGFAMVTKKDFSFMGPFLFVGILVAFLSSIGAFVFNMGAVALAASGMFALLMCGLIIYQTQQIIRGGETNYIMATVTLFVSIYNLFSSLLHLLGFFFGED